MGVSLYENYLGNPQPGLPSREVAAAERGIPLRQSVTEAVEDKLKLTRGTGAKPWMKHLGKLKDLRSETRRINRLIEDAFEEVDPEFRGFGARG